MFKRVINVAEFFATALCWGIKTLHSLENWQTCFHNYCYMKDLNCMYIHHFQWLKIKCNEINLFLSTK